MTRTLRACVFASVLVLLDYVHVQADPHPTGHADHRISPTDSHDDVGTHYSTDHYLRHLVEHAKDIGLNSDQLINVKALQLDFDLARIKTEAEIMLTEREISWMFKDYKTDVAEVEAKIHQSEAMRARLRVVSLKALRKAIGLLTPEQRDKSRHILAAGLTMDRKS